MIRIFLLFLFVTSISAAAQDISITIQPVSVIECLGKPVNIFINAESKASNNLQYQWYKDGEKVSEAVSPVLNFSSLQHNQSGLYFCQVTSEGTSESVNSIPASVYALRPTSITLEPEDVITNIFSGTISLNFDAHINGFTIEESIQKGENVKIQWYQVEGNIHIPLEDNPNYNGTKTNKLSITCNNINDTTKYFASIEGKCGIITTRIASVIKNFNEVVLKLENLEACEGNIYSLKAQITNPQNHKLEFRWFKNGKQVYFKENITGIYSDELLFNAIYLQDSGNYKIEAKIKDINYKVFSNEIDVNVGKEPKIVCVRMDTLIALNTWEKFYRNINTSWLNIFYEKNNLPIRFDIFKNGELIAVRYSDSSLFSLGQISHLECLFLESPNINDIRPKQDSSSFWVIAYNDCGIAYSDTISLFNQPICDPFNQFYKLCVNEPLGVYLDYNPRVPIDELVIEWHDFQLYTSIFTTPRKNEYHTATKNKLELIDLRSFDERHNDETVSYYDLRYEVHRKIDSNTTFLNYNEFCCYYLRIAYLPTILRQPIEKKLLYGVKDTIVYIYFDNEFGKDIEVELYYMSSLSNEPRLIDIGVPEWGMWYNYIRNVTFGEDGYYYAVTRYKITSDSILCESVITDTVKVTVIPKSVAAGVNENDIEPYFSIMPNPASDFIEINLNNEASPIASREVQIFNILGIDVSPAGGGVNGVDGGGISIDVSHLPAGVYYIRLGDKVEKFVKM